jgi:hypothetical protein
LTLLVALAAALSVLSPAPAQATPTPLLAYPSAVQAGVLSDVYVEGLADLVAWTASDPGGDLSVSWVSATGRGQYVVRLQALAEPASTGPHDLVFTRGDTGETVTCTGCLTIGQPTAAPGVVVTPGDGRVDLAITPPTGATVDGYHVLLGATAQDVAGSAAFTDLQNGTSYRVAVTAHTADGWSAPYRTSAVPGTVPTRPTVTATPALDRVRFEAATNSWTYPATYTWTIHTGTSPDQVFHDQGPTFDASGYGSPALISATVVATNRFGDSTPSAAVAARPIVAPGEPRAVRFEYTRGTAVVTWLPPASDGGAPVVGYDVFSLVDGGTQQVHRVSGTSFRFTMPAGRAVHGHVRAVTTATTGTEYDGPWSGVSTVGLLAMLDRNHHAAYRLADEGSWHSLGGPAFTVGISVIRSRRHTAMFLATDAGGRVWARTLGTGWQVVTASRCQSPSASYSGPYGSITLACLDSSGRLLVGSSGPLRDGVVPTGIRMDRRQVDIIGRPSVVEDDVVFRSSSHDGAGHNVLALVPNGQVRRLPLRCTGDPGVGESPWLGDIRYGGLVAACADGPRLVRYLTGDTQSFDYPHYVTGWARSAVDLLGTPSAWQAATGGQTFYGFVAGDGTIREYQVGAGRWRTIGGIRVLPAISGVAWTG